MNRIQTNIAFPSQSTDYLIGGNLLGNLHKIKELRQRNFSSFLLLSDTTIFKIYGKKILPSLGKLGGAVTTSLIEPGEKHKTLSEISAVATPYFKAGFDRKSCLVALGGGVITDLGGFLASILLRGISAIYLPTTLLGQIDASIGGKTGVDFEVSGLLLKNMIGTIKQPTMVITDIDTLSTLPKKEILNGLGEMAKYWVGWGKPEIGQVSNVIHQLVDQKDKANLIKTITQCQRIKIDIVQQDPLETKGIRQKLNLGHTIGHAIEGATNGVLSHGQAVAIGIASTAKISLFKNLCHESTYRDIISALRSLNLPTIFHVTMYRNIATKKEVIQSVKSALKLDKKGGTFVLIEAIGKLKTGVRVERETINQVLTEIIS